MAIQLVFTTNIGLEGIKPRIKRKFDFDVPPTAPKMIRTLGSELNNLGLNLSDEVYQTCSSSKVYCDPARRLVVNLRTQFAPEGKPIETLAELIMLTTLEAIDLEMTRLYRDFVLDTDGFIFQREKDIYDNIMQSYKRGEQNAALIRYAQQGY